MKKKKQGVPAAVKKQSFKAYMKGHYDLYLLLLPAILYTAVFLYIPMYGVLMAFQDYSPVKGIIGSNFVGLKHFKKFSVPIWQSDHQQYRDSFRLFFVGIFSFSCNSGSDAELLCESEIRKNCSDCYLYAIFHFCYGTGWYDEYFLLHQLWCCQYSASGTWN